VRLSRGTTSVLYRVWLTGAVVWLATAPLVWLNYHLVSPVALVLNLILWIPMTVAMIAGFVTLVVGWLLPPLGRIVGMLCDRSLALIEGLIGTARAIDGNHFWLPAPPGWWVVAFYLGLLAVCVTPWLRSRRLLVGGLVVFWFGVAAVLADRPFDRVGEGTPGLECTFVSVGHGTAVFLETSSGATMLYDAGHLGSPLGAVRPVSDVIWSRGVQHIDVVVISHADSDHFNGLPELAQRFSLGKIYVSPVMFEETQPAVVELRKSLLAAGHSFSELSGGERFELDAHTEVEVLHPPRKGVIGSDNANSIVLSINCEGRRVLLPGDLESPGLDDLLAEDPLHADVVMAPHHGSRRSDPTGFSLWSTPTYVVISGSRNVEDEPTIRDVEHSYAARGATVFHTQIDGSVRFELSADGVQATTFRSGKW
jgi:competence protein ComEC